MTLTEFLAARLDEDEATALATSNGGKWHLDSEGNVQEVDTHGAGAAYVAVGPYAAGLNEEDAAHIVRHDPARVLREVEAGRKILAEWQDNELERPGDITYTDGLADGLGLTVYYLACAWSDHPDFDEAWRP
jgi:hypothetical protein